MKDSRDNSRKEIDRELLKKKRQDKKKALNLRRKRKQKQEDRS